MKSDMIRCDATAAHLSHSQSHETKSGSFRCRVVEMGLCSIRTSGTRRQLRHPPLRLLPRAACRMPGHRRNPCRSCGPYQRVGLAPMDQ